MTAIDSSAPAKPSLGRRATRQLFGFALRKARVHQLPDLRLDDHLAPQPIEIVPHADLFVVPTDLPVALIVSQAQLAETDVNGIRFASGLAELERLPRKAMGSSRPWHRRAGSGDGAASFDLRLLLPFLIDPDLVARSYGPLVLPHPLYRFQREGVRFLLDSKPGALLADDMGLGKTVQAIVALRWLFHHGEIEQALVVAPKSVQTSWLVHFRSWSPEIRAEAMVSTREQRLKQWKTFRRNDIQVAIVTYQSLQGDIDRNHVRIPSLGVLIADEVQMIKNAGSKRTVAMRGIHASRRWGLSGTPLENRIEDFATVLRFVDRSVPSLNVPATRRSGSRTRLAEDKRAERSRRLRLVERKARELVLRRRREQVLPQLPQRTSRVQYIDLTSEQRRAYDEAHRNGVAELYRGRPSYDKGLALLHKLKIICNGERDHSSKLEWLRDYIETASRSGERVLVFSQYTNALPSVVQEYFKLKYWGELSGDQRDRVLEEFKQDPDCEPLLMSVRAGGLGLNLQEANHVVHFDMWWNPAVLEQATSRAYRLGQERPVFETILVSPDTIEERILQLLERKRRLFREVVDQLSTKGDASLFSVDELYDILGVPTSSSS